MQGTKSKVQEVSLAAYMTPSKSSRGQSAAPTQSPWKSVSSDDEEEEDKREEKMGEV